MRQLNLPNFRFFPDVVDENAIEFSLKKEYEVNSNIKKSELKNCNQIVNKNFANSIETTKKEEANCYDCIENKETISFKASSKVKYQDSQLVESIRLKINTTIKSILNL